MVAARSALLFGLLSLGTTAPSLPPQRILSAPGVTLRAGPAATAKPLAKLPLGTIVTEVERAPGTETIGDATGSWIRVGCEDGRQGWLFGAFTLPWDAARRDEIATEIADLRLAREETALDGWFELHAFLGRSVERAAPGETSARLELRRLQALARAAAAIGWNQRTGPRAAPFLRENASELVYNEPGGAYVVRAGLFWDLHERYRSLPIADEIAWAGASTVLPGECEGDVPCTVEVLVSTWGRYLFGHPRGAHADEAMTVVADHLEMAVDFPADGPFAPENAEPEARAGLRRNLERLKKIVSVTGHPRAPEVSASADLLIARFP